MSSATNLTVIILTYNEAVNIRRCIENVSGWAGQIFVLDSHSTDGTDQLAEGLGATLFRRKFDNYSAQRNFAIQQLPVQTEWILFLDADEYLSEELKEEIATELRNPVADGYYMKRRFYFMGKWIRFGGNYPIWLLRLFKKDKGLFQREVNEHLVLEGKSAKLRNYFADDNQKSVHFWWHKHIDYAKKEAEVLLMKDSQVIHTDFFGSQSDRKQWIRYKIWYRLPLYLRPFLYYFYRYVLRLGFLDGVTGFIYHFYHGLVYFLIIDTFYLEMKRKQKKS